MLNWLPPAGFGFTNDEVLLRLAVAMGCGLLLGLDRELRGIAAGLRTHAMVALSSAVITLSAFMIHNEYRAAGNSEPDPLRVIQGLAQAIGFIGAGAIFVARGNVHNLTTAANLWLAAAVGIAAAAGQYLLVVVATVLGLVVLTVLRVVERLFPGPRNEDR
jgi:putative Mg2+ transporter-C (MgtC) family protein